MDAKNRRWMRTVWGSARNQDSKPHRGFSLAVSELQERGDSFLMFTCIHCPMVFEPAKAHNGAMILGQTDEQKIVECLNQASLHFAQVHPDIHMDIALLTGQMGWLAMMAHLKTDLPGAKEQFQQVSALICRAVVRHVSDAEILVMIRRHDSAEQSRGKTPGLFETVNVRDLMRELRDYLSYADLEPVPQSKTEVSTPRSM